MSGDDVAVVVALMRRHLRQDLRHGRLGSVARIRHHIGRQMRLKGNDRLVDGLVGVPTVSEVVGVLDIGVSRYLGIEGELVAAERN